VTTLLTSIVFTGAARLSYADAVIFLYGYWVCEIELKSNPIHVRKDSIARVYTLLTLDHSIPE